MGDNPRIANGGVMVEVVSTKAKHVIWWSQHCEHQGLPYEADEDCLMKNLLEPTWTRIIQVKTLCQH